MSFEISCHLRFYVTTSALHQLFISSSSALHQLFISSSSVLYQMMIKWYASWAPLHKLGPVGRSLEGWVLLQHALQVLHPIKAGQKQLDASSSSSPYRSSKDLLKSKGGLFSQLWSWTLALMYASDLTFSTEISELGILMLGERNWQPPSSSCLGYKYSWERTWSFKHTSHLLRA